MELYGSVPILHICMTVASICVAILAQVGSGFRNLWLPCGSVSSGEFAQPMLGKSAQAPMKRPAGCAAPIKYLSLIQLGKYDALFRHWLAIQPLLGRERLCERMLEWKGLHVLPGTMEKYVTRLRAGPIEYLSMIQLVEHEADVRGWLSVEPTVGCRRLCTLMRENKGLRVRPGIAQNYLIRLRSESIAPGCKRRRAVRGSCAVPEQAAP